MKFINIDFTHEENGSHLLNLISEINQFCKLKSLITFGLIDTISKGNIKICINEAHIVENLNSEIKDIFCKYIIKNIVFTLINDPIINELPKKIILYNDNI